MLLSSYQIYGGFETVQLPYFDHCPQQSAKQSPDSWVKKLSVEAAQLCASCYQHEQLVHAPKTTKGTVRSNKAHPHHPITKWVQQSLGNFWWAWEYGMECIYQSFARKLVKSAHHEAFFVWMLVNPPDLPDLGLLPHCKPKGYEQYDPVEAYRRYFLEHKNHVAVWSNEAPEWWVDD